MESHILLTWNSLFYSSFDAACLFDDSYTEVRVLLYRNEYLTAEDFSGRYSEISVLSERYIWRFHKKMVKKKHLKMVIKEEKRKKAKQELINSYSIIFFFNICFFKRKWVEISLNNTHTHTQDHLIPIQKCKWSNLLSSNFRPGSLFATQGRAFLCPRDDLRGVGIGLPRFGRSCRGKIIIM